jgi:uncharacterized alkaline shock family protein YloU
VTTAAPARASDRPPDAGSDTGESVPGSDLASPAERGRTRIADRVVEKIAARAVAEVDNATGVARTVLGVRLGSAGPDSTADVSATVDGGVVEVKAVMSVQWPAPVRTVTRQVRANVTERVQNLTGLRVQYVDIEVTTLLTSDRDDDRRVI